MQVYDPNRTPVVSSNIFQTPDSTASVRVMLAPAAYQLAIRDSLADTQGAYRLSVTSDTAPAARCGIIRITRGITTTQRQDYYQLWVSSANALQTGTYTLTVVK